MGIDLKAIPYALIRLEQIPDLPSNTVVWRGLEPMPARPRRRFCFLDPPKITILIIALYVGSLTMASLE